MKLIMIPLAVMTVLLLFSLAGFGTAEYTFGQSDQTLSGTNTDFYYDEDGIAKINMTTLEAVNPSENIHLVDETYTHITLFYNDTNLFHTYYELFYDTGAEQNVLYFDLGKNYSGSSQVTVNADMNSAFAFIAVVVAISALAAVVGITVFGSGESEFSVSVIVIFSGLLGLWAILSYGGLPMITSIPYGSYLYVIFTLMYTVGCFKSISTGGSE